MSALLSAAALAVLLAPLLSRRAAADITAEECDRIRSQQARAVLVDVVEPAFRAAVVDAGFGGRKGGRVSDWVWPEGCVLRRENDVLDVHEREKSLGARREWHCGLCGKTFREEWFLDKHMATRHADRYATAVLHQPVCLADLCGVMLPCGPLPFLDLRGNAVVNRTETLVHAANAGLPPPFRPPWCANHTAVAEYTSSCGEQWQIALRICLPDADQSVHQRALHRLMENDYLCARTADAACRAKVTNDLPVLNYRRGKATQRSWDGGSTPRSSSWDEVRWVAGGLVAVTLLVAYLVGREAQRDEDPSKTTSAVTRQLGTRRSKVPRSKALAALRRRKREARGGAMDWTGEMDGLE